MNKSQFHFTLIAAPVFVALLLLGCSSAENRSGNQTHTANSPGSANSGIVKVENGYVKPDGWEITDLQSMPISKTGSTVQKTVDGDPLEVEFESRVPDKDVSIIQELPSTYSESYFTKINSSTNLSYNGRVYGYSVTADIVRKDEKTGKYIQQAATVYIFADENGDGKFERYINDSSGLRVPRWVYQ